MNRQAWRRTDLHGVEGAGAGLDAVEALARVPQLVGAPGVRREEVLLGEAPQPEHVVGDLPFVEGWVGGCEFGVGACRR